MSSNLKHTLKTSLQTWTSSSSIPTIVVASMGRSGSTLVYDAVVDAVVAASPMRRLLFSKQLTADWSWEIGEKQLVSGTVYKTHDYPKKLSDYDARCVFLFGSCLDAAISVHSAKSRFGEEWVKE